MTYSFQGSVRTSLKKDWGEKVFPLYSILKFFQVDSMGMCRMTSSTRYFKDGVGASRPN
jgi:hypothetical protein